MDWKIPKDRICLRNIRSQVEEQVKTENILLFCTIFMPFVNQTVHVYSIDCGGFKVCLQCFSFLYYLEFKFAAYQYISSTLPKCRQKCSRQYLCLTLLSKIPYNFIFSALGSTFQTIRQWFIFTLYDAHISIIGWNRKTIELEIGIVMLKHRVSRVACSLDACHLKYPKVCQWN